jgi:hypothetical protein
LTRPDPTHHFTGRVWVDTIFVPGSKNPYPYPYPYFSFGFRSENGPGSDFPGSIKNPKERKFTYLFILLQIAQAHMILMGILNDYGLEGKSEPI